MKLICGLGQPGARVRGHRHNVGFMVVDRLAGAVGIALGQSKFEGRFGPGRRRARRGCSCSSPQTFMNLSGEAVAAAARFYKVAPEDLLVVHDELDLPFGRLQLKAGGGTGGHNGLESIVEQLGTDDFARLRFGIGKPEGPNAKERVVGPRALTTSPPRSRPPLDAAPRPRGGHGRGLGRRSGWPRR